MDPHLPQRPGYGTRGRKIMLWANYFELTIGGNLALHRYSIDILPNELGRTPTGKRAKRIIQLFIEERFPQLLNSIVTDYKSNLICTEDLLIDDDPYVVRYRSEEEDEPSPNAKTYGIRLLYTGAFRVSELVDYLTSTQASALFGSKEEIIQALNIVVGHYPKTVSEVVSIGANKHFEASGAHTDRMNLGAGLQAIRGFFFSVRAATARILVNVQVKCAAFYEEGPLEPLIKAYFDAHGRNMAKLGNFLKKIRVQTTHIVKKNRAGHEIPRIKAITGLATPNDGHGMQQPPIVPYIGAGPKEVKFYIGDPDEPGGPGAKKGKKGRTPAVEGPRRPQDHISVYDFFQWRRRLRRSPVLRNARD
jgi:eukaryotic translation initiation factor 2C